MSASRRREPTITMNEALAILRKAKFQTEMLDRGTIIAHRGDVHYGFSRRLNYRDQQCYSQEAVVRATQVTV